MSRRAVRYTVTVWATGAPSDPGAIADAIGRMPEGWPIRTSPAAPARAPASWGSVPGMRAATARHIAPVSAKARWTLPIDTIRATRSTAWDSTVAPARVRYAAGGAT